MSKAHFPTRLLINRNWAIPAACFSLFLLFSDSLFRLKPRDSPPSPTPTPTPDLVHLTFSMTKALLGWTAPGYHFSREFGYGSDSWVLHIETFTTGIESRYGTVMAHLFLGIPILSPRGQFIWKSIMDELLSAGLSSARQALLSGCSAGGLATFLHCDDFREVLPRVQMAYIKVCTRIVLQESNHRMWFFISFAFFYVLLSSENHSEHKNTCFLVNTAYDFWQIQNVLVPARADPTRSWQRCRQNIQDCSPSQLKILQGFRGSLLKAVREFQKSSEGGLFINSCYIHCQTWYNTTWHSPTSPRINNKTIAESVGDWYFERRRPVKEIDGEYPCNPSCVNLRFRASATIMLHYTDLFG